MVHPHGHIGFERYRIKAILNAHRKPILVGFLLVKYYLYSECRSEVVVCRARFPKGDVHGVGGNKCTADTV